MALIFPLTVTVERIRARLPGLLFTIGISCAAVIGQGIEETVAGGAWIEALVLAIILGSIVRTSWDLPARLLPGIDFSARTLLEIAVALMGATVSFGAVFVAGPLLLAGIVVIVPTAILAGTLMGRIFGLPPKMALLLACGNAICGNSAIAAIAPVIKARSEDVAAAVAFTAILGVAIVILLPLAAFSLGLGPRAGGILAGLMVYAVPQVIAAAGPMGTLAVQTGTLVKLVRVLMLGPVVAVFSLILAWKGKGGSNGGSASDKVALLPWFIVAFLALATLQSFGLLPSLIAQTSCDAANGLTVVAMAGLGLGVDLRKVSTAGPRVVVVVVLSLLFLACAALLLLALIGALPE